MVESYKRKPNTSCTVCGKGIYRRPWEIERKKGNAFCSRKCYGISCRKEIACAVCKKPILAGLNKKTCSRACSNRQRAGIRYKMIGRQLSDKVASQRALKLRLLQARGKCCERCDYDKYEILQVHHKDRKRLNNNMDNLELICPNCHYEEHFLKHSWLKDVVNKGEVA